MDEKKYIRNNEKSYFESNEQLKMIWWLYNSEQLEEELSDNEIEEINQYIRESKSSNMWEIK